MRSLSDRLPAWVNAPIVWAGIVFIFAMTVAGVMAGFITGSFFWGALVGLAAGVIYTGFFYLESRSKQLRKEPELVELRRRAYKLALQGFAADPYTLRAVPGGVALSITRVNRTVVALARIPSPGLSEAAPGREFEPVRVQTILIRNGLDGIASVTYPGEIISASDGGPGGDVRTFHIEVPGLTGMRRTSYRQAQLAVKATQFDDADELRMLISQLEAFAAYS